MQICHGVLRSAGYTSVTHVLNFGMPFANTNYSVILTRGHNGHLLTTLCETNSAYNSSRTVNNCYIYYVASRADYSKQINWVVVGRWK